MKRQLLDILACPVCRYSPLVLDEVLTDGEDIKEGLIRCPKCNSTYPIVEGIPDMLPPKDR
ncbi:MAG: Trm112 family protein [Euryarchaeota archaeon]|nr:Trm112 family protein [Euryarchaeota archaeon]